MRKVVHRFAILAHLCFVKVIATCLVQCVLRQAVPFQHFPLLGLLNALQNVTVVVRLCQRLRRIGRLHHLAMFCLGQQYKLIHDYRASAFLEMFSYNAEERLHGLDTALC